MNRNIKIIRCTIREANALIDSLAEKDYMFIDESPSFKHFSNIVYITCDKDNKVLRWNYILDKNEEYITYEDFSKEMVEITEDLPKTWEEYMTIYEKINNSLLRYFWEHIIDTPRYINLNSDEKPIYKAFIALYKLLCLRNHYRGVWKPDYTSSETKYNIGYSNNSICKSATSSDSYFLSFQSQELRDIFYDNFKELINEAKIFLS